MLVNGPRHSSTALFVLASSVFLLARPGAAQVASQGRIVPQYNQPAPVQDEIPCLLTRDQELDYRNLKWIPPRAPTSPIEVADTLERDSQSTSGSDPVDVTAQKALTNLAGTIRQNYATSSLYSLQMNLPKLQNDAISQAAAAVATSTNSDQSTLAKGTTAVVAPKVEAAQGPPTGGVTSRPPDVSCAMSLMSWDEEHKAFGRTIADTFLAAQMTVRNLNDDYEFLVHDAELAVDANGAQLARFQASHDKELARSVLQYGQSYDRQHEFINIVDGIGTLLGAIVGLPQPSIDALTGASGAYHAGFMPLFHTLVPDLTTKNLNTLNDLAFSAANASRIVVPKGGSVPFVVFIPVHSLEQACWLQGAYSIYKDTQDPTLTSACKQVCDPTGANATSTSNSGSNGGGSAPPPTSDPCANSSLNKVIFKHWTAVQMQALELHAYGLIAGKHIKEVNSQATLNTIACAGLTKDNSGTYLVDPLPQGALNCNLSGSGLDTVTTLRLRSLADPNKTNLDAKVTVSGDNTSATAALAAADVAKIQQLTYELFGVDKSAAEHDLNHSIGFRLIPSITASTPTQTIPATGNFSLNGKNLTGIKQILIYDAADSVQVAKLDAAASTDGKSVTATVATADNLKSGVQYTIRFVLDDGTVFSTHMQLACK
jgi:hypothetical protein